mmetsp:Transcript_25756/g.53842  ORF Transcript_25756/g.53842 Transcript_25756/m.53842 type:complete len:569 (+) Transcript_25756:59-1765(+)
MNDFKGHSDIHNRRSDWKEEIDSSELASPLWVSPPDGEDKVDSQDGLDAIGSNSDFERNKHQETKLLITFILIVVIGTANKIFQKLQAIPMYNYPNTLNLLINFVYVPLCFAYILPVSRYGLLNNAIPAEVTTMSKSPFVIMGLLDCITCMLLTFASVYLPGSLLILLPQAAIPISMAFSKKIKGESYKFSQYFGAVVVILGILVVLEPLITSRHVPDYTCKAINEEEFCVLCGDETTEEGCLSHRTNSNFVVFGAASAVVRSMEGGDDVINSLHSSLTRGTDPFESTATENTDGALCRWVSSGSEASSSSESTTAVLLWSLVTIAACIPMTLSSIYKEMALSGDTNAIDPIFLNGWVALFQFIFSFPLALPAGMTSDPPVTPVELPRNIWDGVKCYLGISTIETGCHPDDQCHESPFYVNMFLAFNVCFNILIVYLLKFGSANVLFMASTVMVPIGNLAFALPFMPGSQPLRDSDVAGLVVILLGLVAYRFGDGMEYNPAKVVCKVIRCGASSWRTIPPLPWRRGKIRRNPNLGTESFSWNYDEDESNVVAQTSRLDEPLIRQSTGE